MLTANEIWSLRSRGSFLANWVPTKRDAASYRAYLNFVEYSMYIQVHGYLRTWYNEVQLTGHNHHHNLRVITKKNIHFFAIVTTLNRTIFFYLQFLFYFFKTFSFYFFLKKSLKKVLTRWRSVRNIPRAWALIMSKPIGQKFEHAGWRTTKPASRCLFTAPASLKQKVSVQHTFNCESQFLFPDQSNTLFFLPPFIFI